MRVDDTAYALCAQVSDNCIISTAAVVIICTWPIDKSIITILAIDEIITRDINKAFFEDEQKKRDVIELEEEFKAEIKKIGKIDTAEKKLEAA